MATIQLDTHLEAQDSFKDVAATAAKAEAMGFSGLWSVETQHEPFMPLAIAATSTRRITLGTGIAIVFPRTPMVLAETSWDLSANSNGRFILGLGTQVKGHNERRFSVPWVPPGPRLNEMSNKGQWQEMTNLITDEMMDAFAVEGTGEQVAATIKSRYDGLLTRTGFRIPSGEGESARWQQIIRSFNGEPASAAST